MRFLGLILIFCTAFSTSASPIPDFPFVTVTGESSRKVAPDTVTIQLQALVFDKKAKSAQLKLEKTTASLVRLLEKHEIDLRNISSEQINKRTKRARNNKSYEDLEILGYELTRQFKIELSNLKNFSSLSNALLKQENIVAISNQFDVSNKQDIGVELIAEAAAKAKSKATQMATGLGVELGTVFAFNDTGSFQTFFATFGLGSERQYNGMRMSADEAFHSKKAAFIPEFIKISKRINVVYKLNN